MHYVIQAWYRFGKAASEVPQNGPLRDGISRRIVSYASREEAQAWIDDDRAAVHGLRKGETGRPLYTVREASPDMDVAPARHPPFHARTAAAEVLAWDCRDIRVLLDSLTRLRAACAEAAAMGHGIDADDLVDMHALPSREFPRGLDAPDVWAIDRQGMALTGEAADRIVPVVDLMEPAAHRNARVCRRSPKDGRAPAPRPRPGPGHEGS